MKKIKIKINFKKPQKMLIHDRRQDIKDSKVFG